MPDSVRSAIAFLLGPWARPNGLPPLAGHRVAGLVLHGLGMERNAAIDHLSDLGVTLRVFRVGLRRKVKSLPGMSRHPEVAQVHAGERCDLPSLLVGAGEKKGGLWPPKDAQLGRVESLRVELSPGPNACYVVRPGPNQRRIRTIHPVLDC